MQRLYSMFPTGRPGVALLLLRFGLSALLLGGILESLAKPGMPWLMLLQWAIVVALWLGVLTPVVTLPFIVIEVGSLLGAGTPLQAMHTCVIFNGVALALLGPGAYSIDARLFGRQRIIFSADESPDAGRKTLE
jgi:hypothetical protein